MFFWAIYFGTGPCGKFVERSNSWTTNYISRSTLIDVLSHHATQVGAITGFGITFWGSARQGWTTTKNTCTMEKHVIWKSQYICCRISTWFHSAPSACVWCNVFLPSHELDNFDCWLLTNVWFEPGFLENAQKSVANVQAKVFFSHAVPFAVLPLPPIASSRCYKHCFFVEWAKWFEARQVCHSLRWMSAQIHFFLWKVNPDQLFNSHLFLSIYVLPRDACWQGGYCGKNGPAWRVASTHLCAEAK